jgi:hypothetical protein
MRLAQCMTPDDLPINDLQGATAQFQPESANSRQRALTRGLRQSVVTDDRSRINPLHEV